MKTGETIGTFNADKLFVDQKHDPDVKGVTLTFAAAGTVKRGTLLVIDSDTGKASPFTTPATETPDCILCDDVTVTAAGDVYTSAYKSGNFSKQFLEEVADVTLTAANIETLRQKGIFVEGVVD